MNEFIIRSFKDADWPECRELLLEVFREGKTYPYSATTTEEQAQSIWLNDKTGVFVAVDAASGQVLGTYYIRPNQPGRGSHICNCGYITSQAARGRGIASAMCEHSQQIAREFGFTGMQFNLVVETNTGAVRLWEKLGFDTIGRLPKVFDHAEFGLVDARIMFKDLSSDKLRMHNDT